MLILIALGYRLRSTCQWLIYQLSWLNWWGRGLWWICRWGGVWFRFTAWSLFELGPCAGSISKNCTRTVHRYISFCTFLPIHTRTRMYSKYSKYMTSLVVLGCACAYTPYKKKCFPEMYISFKTRHNCGGRMNLPMLNLHSCTPGIIATARGPPIRISFISPTA